MVHRSASAGTHQGHFAQVGVNLLRVGVEHISAVALYVGRAACHLYAQVVLRNDFHGEVVFLYLYGRIAAHCCHEAALYLGSGVVGMVQYAELRVPAFAVQVVVAVGVLVEVHAPLHQFAYLRGRVAHHLFYRPAVAYVVAGNHRVLYVLVEVVNREVGNRRNTALRLCCVGLVKRCLADDAYPALVSPGHLEGVTHAGYASAYNQKVILVNHVFRSLCRKAAFRRQSAGLRLSACKSNNKRWKNPKKCFRMIHFMNVRMASIHR